LVWGTAMINIGPPIHINPFMTDPLHRDNGLTAGRAMYKMKRDFRRQVLQNNRKFRVAP